MSLKSSMETQTAGDAVKMASMTLEAICLCDLSIFVLCLFSLGQENEYG